MGKKNLIHASLQLVSPVGFWPRGRSVLGGVWPAKTPAGGMCLVTARRIAGNPPRADQHAFKHFIVFPDLLPADVLCSGREAGILGTEVGAAEWRQGRGVLIPGALSSVMLLRRGPGLKHPPLWQEVGRK